MIGRPHLFDIYGPIRQDKRMAVALSDGLFDRAQRLANLEGLTDGTWLRGLVEREVMKNSVRLSDVRLRTVKAIVHDVKRKA
jgi:hypothetical protein